jgi:hypothetical protein
MYFVADVMPTIKPFLEELSAGTPLDRVLIKGSRGAGSWKDRISNRRWDQNESQHAIAAIEQQQPPSDARVKDVVVTRQNMPSVYIGNVRWV